jgi:uncharacterized circularly permuted ATP-grasp superfamily protein/uncharacterized alpha-E superfamily protein
MQKFLLANYPAANGNYDEMLDSSNQPRAHWRTVLDHLATESSELMRQRVESVQRQVRENGVTYNVYDDSKGAQRPWDLNVLPIVLPSDEWAGIDAAVVQRATLLNRVVCDVYGQQKLLADGLLPAALIHGHAGFLRPCHNIKLPGDIALHFYAVDLARAPDGKWWVVNDRTQAPSGAGYALENRLVISRVFPDLFRDMHIQRLAGFFSTMRDSLAHWGRQCAAHTPGAPGASSDFNYTMPLRDGEQPLIVLLTPGPYNETYHEQAFLARYLGVPLVEGSDLTVRNGMVWLKTLSGLQRVHVIMRRVDDDYCDPLELRADSALGVPGLIEAVRRGNVLVTNSLGSNLPESGALLGFLPAICEHLLGEPLKMPSVGTWWCGEPAALEEVIDRLDEFIIKPTFPQLRQFPVFGQDVQGVQREELIHRMRAHPQQYVAQEQVLLSQAPVWRSRPEGLGASAIGLRVFACATPDGYVVMPGGLTRVATGQDARVITMQRGGSSKDTWVQAAGKVDAVTLLHRSIDSSDLIREDTHLSSRMAENLYWFGRHIERCNNICRLMRAALDYMFTNPLDYRSSEWPAIQWLCAYFHLIPGDLAIQIKMQNQVQGQLPGLEHATIISDEQIESVLLQAIVSLDVPGLASQLQQLHQAASHLRERLSLDNWRTLNQMTQRLEGAKDVPSPADALAILDDVTTSLMGMAGFAMDGMTRDKGWSFFSSGRRIERLQFLCMVLERALRMDGDSSLEWLLELSDSIVTYRSRYMSQPEWLRVLDLLLLDDSNPRSVVFQLKGLLKYMKKLADSYGSFGEEILLPLLAELQGLSVTDLHCGCGNLIDLIVRINRTSHALSEQIAVRFFSYTGANLYGTSKA